MNSGRIFTKSRSGAVNIVPLFTEISKNNCFSIYTRSDLKKKTLDIFKRKPIKDNFTYVSIHAWKTCKWYRPCAKHVFTECSNMADLVNRTQNPHHNQARWSFFIAQRDKVNQTSACRTLWLFKQGFWGSFAMKVERADVKESTCKLYRVLRTVTKSGCFLAKRR